MYIIRMNNNNRSLLLLLITVLLSFVCGYDQQGDGDYGDYGEYGDYGGGDYGDYGNDSAQDDNLYRAYAEKQQEKASGGKPMNKIILFCGAGVSYFLGAKIHSGRVAKNLKSKFIKEQKQLYNQYYNDVYKLNEQNTELKLRLEKTREDLNEAVAEHELEALQRDYDEFKQPDIDGDDRISQAEFNMYVKQYLSNYPGLSEKDYPKFEEFDHDGDGYVSFQEYAQQMALQAQQAELENLYGSGSSKKAQGIQALYEQTIPNDSFNDLYARR